MGGYIEEHQARLNSITSCRCGETIHARSRVPEEDQRSELSYAEPSVVQNASSIPIPMSAPLSTPPPILAAQGSTILEELDSTDVNILRQWFEAKEAAIEADDLRNEGEVKLEEEALTPVSESFWIGTIDPDTPIGEGSGLTEVKDEVPLLFGYCLYNLLRKGFIG